MAIEKTTTQNGVRTFHTAGKYCDQDIVVTTAVPTSTPTLVTKTITQNGTYPASDDSADGYSEVTVNVSGGSVDHGGKYLIQVIDYDGTVLKKDHLNTGASFELPNAPTNHSRLVFQSWCSPVTITNNTITVGKSDITIGALYITVSGNAEYDIVLNANTGLTVTFRGGTNSGDTVWWGDGTITDDGTITHTYANYGEYTIKCNNRDATYAYMFGAGSTEVVTCLVAALGLRWVSSGAFYNCTALSNVSFSEDGALKSTSNNYTFYICYSLKSISVNSDIRSRAFYQCYSLKSIAFNPTSMGQYAKLDAASECYNLTSICLDNLVELGNSAFSRCYALTKITIPNTIASIPKSTFAQCLSIIEYDFTDHSSIPTLSSTSAFNGINPQCKIIVPDNLYSQWVTESNWINYANYIYKASEV